MRSYKALTGSCMTSCCFVVVSDPAVACQTVHLRLPRLALARQNFESRTGFDCFRGSFSQLPTCFLRFPIRLLYTGKVAYDCLDLLCSCGFQPVPATRSLRMISIQLPSFPSFTGLFLSRSGVRLPLPPGPHHNPAPGRYPAPAGHR